MSTKTLNINGEIKSVDEWNRILGRIPALRYKKPQVLRDERARCAAIARKYNCEHVAQAIEEEK
jgi:hypothetical protein